MHPPVAPGTGARPGPSVPGVGRGRLLLPRPLLLEAAVNLTVSKGPGTGPVPGTPACRFPRRRSSWKKPGFDPDGRAGQLRPGRGGPGGPLRTSGGSHRNGRLVGHDLRLLGAEAGQGARPGRHPSLGRGPAVPRPGLERRRRGRSSSPVGRGDPPVAERRRPGRARARRLDRVSRGERRARVPNVIGSTAATPWTRCARPGSTRSVEEEGTTVTGKWPRDRPVPAAGHRAGSRGPEVTIVVRREAAAGSAAEGEAEP